MVPKDTMAKWEWIPGEAQAKASIQDLGLGGGSCSVDPEIQAWGRIQWEGQGYPGKGCSVCVEEGQWGAEGPEVAPGT